MSEGKIAAQVSHAVLGLKEIDSRVNPMMTIVALGVSDKKFNESGGEGSYTVFDAGYTEVKPGTATVTAWIEE